MDCKDINKLLTAYLEGVASPEEEEQVKAHLETCPSCREELEIRRTSRERLGKALKLASLRVTPTAGSWERITEQSGIRSSDEKRIRKKSGIAWLAIPLSIFLLIILVGSFVPMLGGMSPPPPAAPITVSDKAGGAFLVWLDRPYHQHETVIRSQHVDAQGNRLWGEEGLPIARGNISISGAVSDDRGGILIAWGNSNSSYLQRLDAAGNTLWTLENVTFWSVAGMAGDGSGGAMLLWYDRNGHIYTQRVSGDGVLLWGDKGVLVGTTGDDYSGMSIAGDGLGGSVIAWQEKNNKDVIMRAQRISVEGTALWGDSGIVVTTISNGQGIQQEIVSDGTGNFIIAWDTGSATPDTDVYVQKLDKDGNLLWGEGGILVCRDQAVEPYNPANMQSHPQIVADGTGGVIVTWHDRRRIMNREVFAQKLRGDGEMLWAENGVWLWDIPEDYIGTTSGILSSSVIADGDGGAVVVWTGYANSYTSNTVIYAQRLSRDGRRLWPDETVYINPTFQSQGYADVAGDGHGGAIIGSRVGESSSASQTDSVYAQRISSDGSRMWGKSGLEIQMVRSALTIQFIAVGAILAAVLVLSGIFRRSRIAGIFSAIIPVLLGVAGLFSIMLVIGPFGYTYGWAYIPDTAVNKVAAAIIPLSGLAIGVFGIWKKVAPKWVTIPMLIFSVLVVIIAGLILIS